MKVFEKAFWLAEVPEVHTTDDMGWGWCTPSLHREWAAVCHSCGPTMSPGLHTSAGSDEPS